MSPAKVATELPSDYTTVLPILATVTPVTTTMDRTNFVNPATFPAQLVLMPFPAVAVQSTGSPTDHTAPV